jgi:ankyrin repeat protein
MTLLTYTASLPDRGHILEIMLESLQKSHRAAIATIDDVKESTSIYDITRIKCKYQGSGTVLHYAAASGNLATVRRLVHVYGIPSHVRDHDGNLALHWSNTQGHYDICEYFIKAEQIPVDTLNDKQRTPLHIAMEMGFSALVDLYIKHGASLQPNNKGLGGATLLHFVARSPALVHVVPLLLATGNNTHILLPCTSSIPLLDRDHQFQKTKQ